jgi:DNA-binding YbaB/EbfC family protein
MFDILGKLSQMKSKMEEVKNRLDAVSVTGESGGGEVKVTVNGNRQVLSVKIEPHLLFPEKKEEVEELVETAMNRALEEATKVSEAEMKAVGKDLLPGFPL